MVGHFVGAVSRGVAHGDTGGGGSRNINALVSYRKCLDELAAFEGSDRPSADAAVNDYYGMGGPYLFGKLLFTVRSGFDDLQPLILCPGTEVLQTLELHEESRPRERNCFHGALE